MFKILRYNLQSPPWYLVISLFVKIERELCLFCFLGGLVYNLYCYYLYVPFFCNKKNKQNAFETYFNMFGLCIHVSVLNII